MNSFPKENAREGFAAIAAVLVFLIIVWLVLWRDIGIMETLFYAGQLLAGISAAGIAATLFIFYHRPAIKELLRGDFWISTAFVVSFALIGLQYVSAVIAPVQKAIWVNAGTSLLTAGWLTLKWLFIVRRLVRFADSPTIEDAKEAHKVIEQAEETIRKATEVVERAAKA
jgi:hypothetical protein